MKTLIVENCPEKAKEYEAAKIDRIFVDLEILGKDDRQGHLDTVISRHSVDDITPIKEVLTNSELLVRVNPINANSESEINEVIENGADIVMLPMFKEPCEVEEFIRYVANRAKTCLLLETSEALGRLDSILDVKGIDEVHVGLNDLHLALGLRFMFEIMADGLLEHITAKIKAKGIPFGIGGVARMDEGMLQGKVIMREHARLGSTAVILSRTFKGANDTELSELTNEVDKLQQAYTQAKSMSLEELALNRKVLVESVSKIAVQIKKNES